MDPKDIQRILDEQRQQSPIYTKTQRQISGKIAADALSKDPEWRKKSLERWNDPEYKKAFGKIIKESTAHQAARDKLVELRKTTPRSLEANKKNSEYKKGRKASPETCKKIQEITSGRPTGRKKPVMTPKGRFEKLKDAAAAYDVDPTLIRYWMNKDPDNFYFIVEDAIDTFPVMTPDGPFKSRKDAGEFYKISGAAIGYRMKVKPTQYYRITNEEYLRLTGKQI